MVTGEIPWWKPLKNEYTFLKMKDKNVKQVLIEGGDSWDGEVNGEDEGS
jgi:hypothetical protein